MQAIAPRHQARLARWVDVADQEGVAVWQVHERLQNRPRQLGNNDRSQGTRPSNVPVLLVEAHRGLGGPPATVRDLAPGLQQRRPVVVAIPDGAVKQHLDTATPAVPTVELPWSGSRFRDRLRAQPVLLRTLLRLGRCAVVHANGKSALNLIAPALRLLRVRPVVFVHFHDSEFTVRDARAMWLWKRLGVRVVVAPVSKQSAAQLAAHGLGHIVKGLLANPIAQPSRPPGCLRSSRSHVPFRVATVVDRSPRKGLDVVIETARTMSPHDVVFDAFGVSEDSRSNDYFDRCLRRRQDLGLADQVQLLGRVKDLPARLMDYDCLLITSRRESFCRVALEGMAAEIPVVAPRIDGLVEAVGDGNCLLYDHNQPTGAANAVARLMQNPALAKRYRLAGREWVERFTPDSVCDDLEELYRAHDLVAAPS